MLTLWMFGAPIEETWGTQRFLQYYFLCGIGAGICVVVANLHSAIRYQRVLGASGRDLRPAARLRHAVPESDGAVEFPVPDQGQIYGHDLRRDCVLSSFQSGSTVSNLAHLGGMIFGFVYMKTSSARESAARVSTSICSGGGKNTNCSARGRSSRST